jgi:uncharacterized protein
VHLTAWEIGQDLSMHILAIYGEKDVQVCAEQNHQPMNALLARKNSQVVTLTGLNHLMQNCQTGAMSEYAQIEETMAPHELKIMNDWIKKQTAYSSN